MTPSTLSEEEFKKVLKSLLAEKKRIKELQKKLDEKGLQKKFQTKLSDIHKLSLTEEYAKLKNAYFEKEKECEEKKEALSKVKPAIKKLYQELTEAKKEIERYRSQTGDDFKKILLDKERALEKAKEKIISLEREKIEEGLEKETRESANLLLQTKNFQLEEKLTQESLLKNTFENQALSLEKRVQEKEEEIAKKAEDLEREFKRFEEDKVKLVEKLAESLSQVKLQTEATRELKLALEKAEMNLMRKEKELMESEPQMVKNEMEELIRKKEKVFEETLDLSYQKLRELSQIKGHLIEEKENLSAELEKQKEVEREWSELKEDVAHLKALLDENEKELSKARAHLAKKVKETTLLTDLFQNQNLQMSEFQERVSRQKEECEQMQSALVLKNLNEERLLNQLQERAAAHEALIREWQEKYLDLQRDWQEKKNQLQEFQKMKTQYDQMSRAFSEMKSFLGKNLDTPHQDTSL